MAFFIKDENGCSAKLRKGRRHLTLELVSGVVGGLLDLVGRYFDVIVHFWKIQRNHKIQMNWENTMDLFVTVDHITLMLDKAMHQNWKSLNNKKYTCNIYFETYLHVCNTTAGYTETLGHFVWHVVTVIFIFKVMWFHLHIFFYMLNDIMKIMIAINTKRIFQMLTLVRCWSWQDGGVEFLDLDDTLVNLVNASANVFSLQHTHKNTSAPFYYPLMNETLTKTYSGFILEQKNHP